MFSFPPAESRGERVSDTICCRVLRGLSEHCEFGGHLDDALHDRFMCGLKSEATQKRLTETTLTFQRAVELAVSMETASREAHQLSGSLTVNALSLSKTKTANNKCKRCGKDNHSDDDCWFKVKICNTCGKKGHISRVCRKSNNDRKTKSGNRAKAARPMKETKQKGYVKKESAPP